MEVKSRVIWLPLLKGEGSCLNICVIIILNGSLMYPLCLYHHRDGAAIGML